jgi:hypothetical protein
MVTTDYAVPAEIDTFTTTVAAPDMEIQTASAPLTGPDDLPRTLGLVHEDGPLGSFDVTVEGTHAGSQVATRRARFAFQEGRTLALRIHLSRACETAERCVGDETCAAGACRPIQIAPDELEPWPPPRDASMDAPSVDAMVDSAVPDSAPGDSATDGRADASDGAVDAGVVPCDALFSGVERYHLCDEGPTDCEFYADPAMDMSCAQVCDLAAQTCVEAYQPAGSGGPARCSQDTTSACDAPADELLCVCSRTSP